MRQPLTLTQASLVSGLSVSQLRRLADRGEIPTTYTPLGRLLSADGVEKIAADRSEKRAAREAKLAAKKDTE